jgi:hypothetical protein
MTTIAREKALAEFKAFVNQRYTREDSGFYAYKSTGDEEADAIMKKIDPAGILKYAKYMYAMQIARGQDGRQIRQRSMQSRLDLQSDFNQMQQSSVDDLNISKDDSAQTKAEKMIVSQLQKINVSVPIAQALIEKVGTTNPNLPNFYPYGLYLGNRFSDIFLNEADMPDTVEDGESKASDDGESKVSDDGESKVSDDGESKASDDGESKAPDDGESKAPDEAVETVDTPDIDEFVVEDEEDEEEEEDDISDVDTDEDDEFY